MAAHALFIALQWQGPMQEAARSARMAMRLVSPPARQSVALGRQPVKAKEPVRNLSVVGVARPDSKSSARAKIQAPRLVAAIPAELQPTPAQPRVEPQAPPITGVAFGLPRLGTPGGASARWMRRPSEPPAELQSPPPAMLMQMQAARAAGRAQIADALQRELVTWQTPHEGGDGACAVSIQPDARLACDNDRLMAAMAPREAVLAELLRAYRSMDPHTEVLSIALVQGRYQAAWSAR